MGKEEAVVKHIANWFEKKGSDVANILAGPRREGWFNAEIIVALSRRARIDRFVVYGEQVYGSVCKGAASEKKKLLSRIPDVVGYLPNGKAGFVIEGKLIFRSDSKTKRASDLQKLAAQVREAKIRCPKGSVHGPSLTIPN